MSAKRGWIGQPQPTQEWHDSHYSRQADRIAEKNRAEQEPDAETKRAEPK
jgi:hypothetical protein